MEATTSKTKARLWTGRIISILVILFMAVDAGMKIVKATPSMEETVQLGWPAAYVPGIGITLMICTILYAITRTAVLGALLMTAYLGGATAIMLRSGTPYFFPVIMGIIAWVGLALKDEKVRRMWM